MKKKYTRTIAMIVLGASLLTLQSPLIKASGNLNNAIPYETKIPTINATPAENQIINLLSGDVYAFSSNYIPGCSAQYSDGTDKYYPDPVTISWASEEGAEYFTVKLSRFSDLSDSLSYVTFDNKIVLNDLFMGTHYYYQVVAFFADRTVKSQIFEFETAYLPRTVRIEGISNTRDIGGYYTVDGKYRVRQGLVYRGGETETVTEAGKITFLETLGIKTDLDLRGYPNKAFGSAVNHVSVSGPYYHTRSGHGITNKNYKEALITEIKTFANPDNYPIYVHCSLGRDRTGTLCFLINALCGVGKTDLYRDYEMSWLSLKGSNTHAAAGMIENHFSQLYDYINTYPTSVQNPTIADRTEAFMKEYLGITQNEINTIRSILLEEVIQ